MKNLLVLFLVALASACSGTKQTIQNTQKNILKTSVPSDSINEITKVFKGDTIVKPEKDTIEDPVEFNQKITKQTFTNTHELWDQLLKKHVSHNGNVNYKAFKTEHKKLLDYIYVLSLIHSNKDFKTLAKTEKLTFWINAYNAMTIDLILRYYPINSIKDIKKPWDQRFWKLGSKWYNLNDIEHNILRKMNEPRIHFAIVCASYSCPKLQNEAFKSSNIEEQLTQITKEFLSDSERNHISKNSIQLSKIFQWFAKDFKENGSLIDFLNLYSDIKISAKAKKIFKDYNWSLNE